MNTIKETTYEKALEIAQRELVRYYKTDLVRLRQLAQTDKQDELVRYAVISRYTKYPHTIFGGQDYRERREWYEEIRNFVDRFREVFPVLVKGVCIREWETPSNFLYTHLPNHKVDAFLVLCGLSLLDNKVEVTILEDLVWLITRLATLYWEVEVEEFPAWLEANGKGVGQ